MQTKRWRDWMKKSAKSTTKSATVKKPATKPEPISIPLGAIAQISDEKYRVVSCGWNPWERQWMYMLLPLPKYKSKPTLIKHNSTIRTPSLPNFEPVKPVLKPKLKRQHKTKPLSATGSMGSKRSG